MTNAETPECARRESPQTPHPKTPMPIEYRDRQNSHATTVVTTACALCGATIGDQQSLAVHLEHDCPEVPM